MSQPRVFVSHSHKDETFTERLVADLRQAGADAWMDKTDLGAGNWQQHIDEALAKCEWFVLVLTPDALESPWVREEVYAAKRLKNQGHIRDLLFIQAQSMDHLELPATWGIFNIFDATQDYDAARNRALVTFGLAPLLPAHPILAKPLPSAQPTYLQVNELQFQQHNKSRRQEKAAQPQTHAFLYVLLPQRFTDLGFTAARSNGLIEYVLPPLCTVPAGPFLMGSDPKRDKQAYDFEQPQHRVSLPKYQIARFPVTVAEYAYFVHAGHAEPQNWQTQLSKLDHPVVNVTWQDAVDYAHWLSERTSQSSWRLPTEAEWEKAARGTHRWIYPWGDNFDKSRCNTSESGIRATTPVGNYPSGASPYDAEDFAGNVWEWTSSLDSQYPYTVSGEGKDPNSAEHRMLRGGSWDRDARRARAAYRLGGQPGSFRDNNGFRLVRSSSSS